MLMLKILGVVIRDNNYQYVKSYKVNVWNPITWVVIAIAYLWLKITKRQ